MGTKRFLPVETRLLTPSFMTSPTRSSKSFRSLDSARGALVDEGAAAGVGSLSEPGTSTAAPAARRPERHSENNIMMQIDCPFCGRRDETEFSYGVKRTSHALLSMSVMSGGRNTCSFATT